MDIVAKNILLICFLLCLGWDGKGQYSPWVDSIYASMTEDQRIGQLFTIRAFSKKDQKHYHTVKAQIKKFEPGGICFFQGSPNEQARLVKQYQSLSEIPLLVSIDGEWGVSMRYPKEVINFPRQLTLGAIQNENLIYEMGKEIAYQCQQLGIHINYAPVVDVNNNPANPVINNRSFGEDIYNVAAKGFAYMKGMQDHGVIACAKHFPGHGDTDVDSHKDLPVINHNRKRLDSLELMPFQVLIDQGIKSIMVAHMEVPAIDKRKNRPTTLSAATITELLKEEMGFRGLVFTDAMEMQGVLKHYPTGQAEVEALKAGNDNILLSMDIEKSVAAIKAALKNGELDAKKIETSVKKTLQVKHDLGLHEKVSAVSPAKVDSLLNRPEAMALKYRLVKEAITLVSDQRQQLPIADISGIKIAALSIGSNGVTPFQKRVGDYIEVDNYSTGKDISPKQKLNLLSKLKGYDRIIVSLHTMSKLSSQEFGITSATRDFLDVLYKQNINVTTVLFGSPYALTYFSGIDQVIVAYEEDEVFQDVTAQAIFGGSNFRGKLPVSAGGFAYGDGVQREALGRLGYDIPENVGLRSDSLALIDGIMEEMIEKQAAPGGQVLVAKDGKIVYHKTFGHFTYRKRKPVDKNDIYDVASVTKILASTISLMKLVDEEKLSVKDRASKYISQLDTTNKKDMVLDEMLAHHAKLIGWIPFYSKTVSESRRNPRPLPTYYSRQKSKMYSVPVAKNLFLRSDYRDTMWSMIYGSKLRENEGYRYSDLGFYLVHNTIKEITGQGVDEYAEENFYLPLGLTHTGFNPALRFGKKDIAPTEEDIYFRRQRLQGYVHDMGAAMLGGVSGHAGLFSNSKELAVLMQMLLNGGYYGGKRYLTEETIDLFTTRYHRSTRRGLGFDMKELDDNRPFNMSEFASDRTFGHYGFTGTAVFADPEHNIICVFLSNRTYPRMQNNKLARYEYRPRVQSAIYRAMEKPEIP